MLQSLSNVVTARANARQEGVGSSGRARGLLQKPALPAQGRQGWLQARRAGGNVSEV
jgi:hypothetical protein